MSELLSLSNFEVESYLERLSSGDLLKETEIKCLCQKYIEILQNQPNIKKLSSPITVILKIYLKLRFVEISMDNFMTLKSFLK